MRRGAVGVGLVLGIGALAWWFWPADPAEEAWKREAMTRRVVHFEPVPSEVEAGPGPDAFVDAVLPLESSCDLPVQIGCSGEACVALMRGPDLDDIRGWLEIAWDRPRFVASTALRDLGMRPDWLPCGGAIRTVTDGRVVLSVAESDGSEVWCAVPDDLALAGLCDALAAKNGWEARGFTDPDCRRLDFGG